VGVKQARRAVVIGGSMSGLFAGLLLRRHGWDVTIFERSPVPMAGRGAGIVTHPELRAALGVAGIAVGPDLGVPIALRRTLDRDGNVLGEYACPQIATSWNKLFEMLKDGFPAERYLLGKELARIEDRGDEVVARFADGSTASADLLVGADGFRSSVRGQDLPQVQPLYAGYVAWRGLVAERAFPPDLQRELFPHFVFCLPPGEQMLGYPVAGPDNDLRVGYRFYNLVWYRPALERSELPRLLTDDTGHTHAISIPPPLIAKAVVAEMRAHAEEVLAPQFRALVRLTEQPFLQPIYDLETPRMALGRVALIGDAAFVARPHVGAGVSKAADDAIALAAALDRSEDVAAALQAFEAERIPVGRRIIERARHLGAYMRTSFDTAEERALAERHHSPQAVMAETALLDFLHA
jgi:2-polyprenyl-6-methoxyphenol hydroxylase-like FAD-dependent oxidoreductase